MTNLFIIGNFTLTVILLIVSSVSFIKLMKNDLQHLSKDVAELKKDVKECVLPKIYKINERVSFIEGELKKSK